MRRSIAAVGIAAATERTVCSGVSSRADLAEQDVEVLRLDRDHDQPGIGDRLPVREGGVDAEPVAQLGGALLAPAVAVTSSGFRQSELSSPASSDSPIFPAAEDRDATAHAASLRSQRASVVPCRSARGADRGQLECTVPSYGSRSRKPSMSSTPSPGSRYRRGFVSQTSGWKSLTWTCATSSASSCAWSSWPWTARNSVSIVTRHRGSRSQARRTLSSGVPTVHGIVSTASVRPCSSAASRSPGSGRGSAQVRSPSGSPRDGTTSRRRGAGDPAVEGEASSAGVAGERCADRLSA